MTNQITTFPLLAWFVNNMDYEHDLEDSTQAIFDEMLTFYLDEKNNSEEDENHNLRTHLYSTNYKNRPEDLGMGLVTYAMQDNNTWICDSIWETGDERLFKDLVLNAEVLQALANSACIDQIESANPIMHFTDPDNGMNLMHYVVKNNNVRELKYLVTENELRYLFSTKNNNGQTPLDLAIALGREEAVKILQSQ